MSNLLDFISNIIPITGNPIVDTVIFFIISVIAFVIAWLVTGALASAMNYDSDSMSAVHWFVRFLIFFGLLGLAIGLVHLIKWFLSFEWWVYLIFGISVSLIVAGVLVLKMISCKRKEIHTHEKYKN